MNRTLITMLVPMLRHRQSIHRLKKIKIKLLIFIALTSLAIKSNAQTPNWNWSHNNVGTYNDAGSSVTIDNSGNVYVTGTFSSPIFTLGGIALTRIATVGTDIFIAKYNSAGTIIWAKNFGGRTYETNSNCITIDNSGNVYVTGWFAADTLVFGSTTLINAHAGNYDMFMAKFDNSGNVIWAKSAGGTSTEKGNSITTDNNGYVYITGVYSSNFTIGSTALTNSGSFDVFIAKYDTNGNNIWVKSAGGTVWDEGYCLSVDIIGNVYVSGTFTSPTLIFGSTTLINAGSSDMFIVKYGNSGNVLWAKSTGSIDYETANSVIVDGGGNTYVTGSFSSPFISFGSTILTKVSGDDLFIVKYDNAGHELWARSIGGNGSERGECVDVDNAGNAYITGWFSSSTLTFGSTTIINAGGRNIFVSKWDALGNVVWVKSPYGNNYHTTKSGKADASGNVYITGDFFCSTLTFGSIVLTNSGVANTGDIFVAKLGNAFLGVSDFEKKEKISIYPNPFSTQTILQTDFFLKNATLTVYNCFGQTVKQINNLSGPTITLVRDNLSSGLYFIRLTQDNKVVTTDKLTIMD